MLELYVNNTLLDQESDVTLDEVDFKYRIYWNSYYSRYYMDWKNGSGEMLSAGTKITVGQPLVKSRLFKGSLIVLNTSIKEDAPLLGELGSLYKLIYIPVEEYDDTLPIRPLDSDDE